MEKKDDGKTQRHDGRYLCQLQLQGKGFDVTLMHKAQLLTWSLTRRALGRCRSCLP